MDMVNISIGTGGVVALLGYAVVFVGLILLMLVVMLMSRIMIASEKKNAAPVPAAAESAAPVETEKPKASGTAGELKLYDTDPRDAAMIMAIVADTLHKPLNELRFISIREVREDEV